MRKCIYSLFICILFFVCTSSVSAQYGTSGSLPIRPIDLSQYRVYKRIVPPQIQIPTVMEFPITDAEVRQQPFLMIDTVMSKPVYAIVKTKQGSPPILIVNGDEVGGDSASFDTTPLIKMYDNNVNTDYEVQTNGTSISTVTFLYSSTRLISSSQLRTTLAQYAYAPEKVTIYANDPNTQSRKLIISDIPYNSTIQFPQTQAYVWSVTFKFTQPLRIAELQIVPDNQINAQYSTVRFLAQPGKTYEMYLNPDRTVERYGEEYVDLDQPSAEVISIPALASETNPSYRQADQDNDGIVDQQDNCPYEPNPDQKDINGNRTGDACEDFDHDGVLNSRDNCPNDPNASQANADNDAYGDVCDPEESRITERLWWLPWLGIVVGFGVVFAIFASTAKSKHEVKE